MALIQVEVSITTITLKSSLYLSGHYEVPIEKREQLIVLHNEENLDVEIFCVKRFVLQPIFYRI